MTAEPNDLVIVFKAQSIIQREALVNALGEVGIEAVTAPRDMSRKVADDTVDLALEGYSAMFDGFAVLVKNRDKAAADRLIKKFIAATDGVSSGEIPAPDHLRKYYFCSIFSFMLPGIMHIFGLYHLIKGLKNRERVQPFKFISATLLFLGTLWLVILVFTDGHILDYLMSF